MAASDTAGRVLDYLRRRRAAKLYVRLCGAHPTRARIREVWPLITRY